MRSEVIKKFLDANALPHFAQRYESNMQCHVLVSGDGGERENKCWTDGIETWYPFVISSHESDDKIITYNFDKHVEGIGLTGWDWESKCSRWVAFDFDSVVGHKTGLQQSVLDDIVNAVTDIEWVTVVKSTSGRGIHLYVDLEPTIPTENRAEHSAVARAVLHQLSGLTGYSFVDKVDICGGNMFIWHRKMLKSKDGLTLVKEGISLRQVPNWRDHIEVITKGTRTLKEYDPTATSQTNINLDDEHKRLLTFLQDTGSMWWWDDDRHMLICHTYDLAQAFEELSLKGLYKTVATGRGRPDHNCFCFPRPDGGWIVRRFNKGAQEESTWTTDASGWTKCYFNIEADLEISSRAYNGIEHKSGYYAFNTAEECERAASVLGIHLKLPPVAKYCSARMQYHKDKNRIVVTILDKEHKIPQQEMVGWLLDNKSWTRIFNTNRVNVENSEKIHNYDDLVRHLITPTGEEFGWALRTDTKWIFESLSSMRLALTSRGLSSREVTEILGDSIYRHWRLVNRPFKEEYPGNRCWNKDAAQMRFAAAVNVPTSLQDGCPNWYKYLNHIGQPLNECVKNLKWAKDNDIHTGADYLFAWIASLFQEPTEPLPYLFLYGEQNTGKSMFHELLQMLMIGGYAKADMALTNQSGFNAELEHAVVCVVEEVHLGRSITAANRIKDWVTAKEIAIHGKNKTIYMTRNVTHWIQCSNNHDSCPIFPGDTRIVVINVPTLRVEDMIPKRVFMDMLESEASNFMSLILNYQIPNSHDRLHIPVITTSDKLNIEHSNKTLLEMFIDDCCKQVNGHSIKFGEFYDRFIEWMGPTTEFWSKQRVGRELPPLYPKGRYPKTGQFYIGNITFDPLDEPDGKYILSGDKLIKQEN